MLLIELIFIDRLLFLIVGFVPGTKNRREKKVTKMVYLMILAFLIAWSPYAVLALATQYFYVSIVDHAKFNVLKILNTGVAKPVFN